MAGVFLCRCVSSTFLLSRSRSRSLAKLRIRTLDEKIERSMEGLFLVLDALLKLGSMRTRRRELDLGKRNRDDYKTYKIRQQWGQ
ncbi:predicted protein [Sclerotinia sclerotiorum 1980 UF-70]|uniref:Uncharacterized protein n=1 Tax=Sclerotinia sclerotiorum (strain ATCC 18683 / 1980 / Ss-1) TaxID=665079 RepID=A7E5U2_SCLS1|nr:predicted protein [Sclerotinia sclerotiorum 1980 UF-70]EDN91264.1 predicted protein [Sclerotinia sclerotiorum 1980 UF-70]